MMTTLTTSGVQNSRKKMRPKTKNNKKQALSS